MSDPINVRTLAPGTRIALADGAVAEIVSNPEDGVWLFARFVEAPVDPDRVGQEEMIFAQDVVEVRTQAESQHTGPNAAQIAYWNSPAARAWSDQHERIDRVLGGLFEVLLQAASPQPGEAVLDIGCGSGTTVLELAKRVGPAGYVLGADIAAPSVARLRQRIAAGGLRQAEAVHADAATHLFAPARFDLATSRLGVMFFADPTAAFANIRRAMKPDGRLALAVFRSRTTPFPQAPVEAVRHLLPPVPAAGTEDPGPLSWADEARVRRILGGAGFRDVSLTPVDPVVRLAPPGGTAEAADFVMEIGPLTRILPGLAAERQNAIRNAVENFFAAHDGPHGITLPAAIWIVQARA